MPKKKKKPQTSSNFAFFGILTEDQIYFTLSVSLVERNLWPLVPLFAHMPTLLITFDQLGNPALEQAKHVQLGYGNKTESCTNRLCWII